MFLFYFLFFCQVLSCGYAEESTCTPGFESELFVFKVHRDHLHMGKILGRGRLFSQISFTFMHLADAFIQSDLQLHSGKFLISMCVPWELNPQPFALLMQCSTTEPQEHYHKNAKATESCLKVP